MEKEKFYIKDGDIESGPYSLEELRAMSFDQGIVFRGSGYYWYNDLNALLTQYDKLGNKIASGTKRLSGYIIVLIVFYVPIVILLNLTTNMPVREICGYEYFLDDILYLAVSLVINFYFYSKHGGNLGHYLLNLKVVDQNTGEPLEGYKGLLREFLKIILSIFIIPIVALLFNVKKQNWYDKIVNSIVIENK